MMKHVLTRDPVHYVQVRCDWFFRTPYARRPTRGSPVHNASFWTVMADDLPGASSVADVASRAGKSRSWANAYRRSLIDASVIEQAGQGRVAYAIPHFGEYMQRCRDDRWAFGASVEGRE
jgi:hypothetical protein